MNGVNVRHIKIGLKSLNLRLLMSRYKLSPSMEILIVKRTKAKVEVGHINVATGT